MDTFDDITLCTVPHLNVSVCKQPNTQYKLALQRKTRISHPSFENRGRLFILILHAFVIWVRSFFSVPRRSPAAGPVRGLHGRRGRRRRTSPWPPRPTWWRPTSPRPPAQHVSGAADAGAGSRDPPGAPTPTTAVRVCWTTQFGSRQQGKALGSGQAFHALATLRSCTFFVLHYKLY